jgi:hypothetical protein
MRKILIVGAGQSGLQLALTLQGHGYEVTVMSARTSDEIRNGWVTSTQCMFDDALSIERKHGLNFFDEVAPRGRAQGFSLGSGDGSLALNWYGIWKGPAQSVDQRVKMAVWLELFEERGGKVVIHGVTTADLNSLATMYDLVVVAAGKGEIVELFDRDAERSEHSRPQRVGSVSYVHGVESRPEQPGIDDVWLSVAPGVGELINIPGYTKSGPCYIFYMSGIPGGPFDAFADRPGPEEQLRRQLDLLRQHMPWEYERSRNAEITDAKGILSGAVTPTVRKPVGHLPSGACVLGMADVVVLNDPVTGQGSNGAAKCAESYLNSILEHGDRPFDEAWMRATFERYWEYSQWVAKITSTLLAPPSENTQQILGAAQANEQVAARFAEGLNNPPDLANWFWDPEKTRAYLESVS